MASPNLFTLSIKKNKLQSHYDAVVIGAGIAGLVCGTFLAYYGKKVLILEQHFIPGGYCTSFKRKGFTFDAAVHHIGGCGKWSIVGQCFRTLGIEMDFYALDPMDHLIFPDNHVVIPADISRYIAQLQSNYPMEKDNIQAFFRDFIKLYRATFNNEKSQIIETYKDLTYEEMLRNFFEDEKLMRTLSGQWGYIGLPPHQASAVAMCQMLVNYLKDGAFFPAGGTQAFTNAILKKFIDFGGHIMLSSRVEKILCEDNIARGVRLENNKEIHSGLVISNIDARRTFFELLEGKAAPSFLQKIEQMKESCSFFLLYLGLDEGVDLRNLKRGFYYIPEETSSPAGEWLYISIPTNICPNLAPANKHIVSVVVSLKVGIQKKISDWKSFKEIMAKSTINRLEEYIPLIREHIEVEEAATPKTLERYTSNTNGAAYGWAVSVSQMLENRLPQKTPVDNLYLTGHWTKPGPGICAVVSSGWGVANLIMKDRR